MYAVENIGISIYRPSQVSTLNVFQHQAQTREINKNGRSMVTRIYEIRFENPFQYPLILGKENYFKT